MSEWKDALSMSEDVGEPDNRTATTPGEEGKISQLMPDY